jgi:glycosyltransferase involved in cell wall biosynthesis
MSHRLAIFDSHPIHYFAPLWRQLAETPGLELVVHYFSDHSIRGGVDPGFGVPVAWDTPVTAGYEHRFITRDADLSRMASVRMPDPRKLLREGRFDAAFVHGYMYGFARQAVRAARALGLGSILRGEFSDVVRGHGRSAAKSLARNIYLRWFYSYVDAFCYIGKEAQEHLMRRGIPHERMFFSPYAVDTTHFEEQNNKLTRAGVRAALGIADDQFVILFSGKLIPRKAPRNLVQALSHLPDTSRITLILLGDGPERAELETAGRSILGDRLQITGFVNQSQIGKYYAAADLFVLPSQFETWGLVVNEAMQFGLPVIVSDRVGCRHDVVLEGITGFSFEVGNSAQLAERLQLFLADRRLGPRIGDAAALHIQKYSIKNAAAGIAEAVRYATQAKQSRKVAAV